MKKIRITKTPPGLAPEHIRKYWVGCEIPLVTQEELDGDPPSNPGVSPANENGFCVSKSAAIAALRDQNKTVAADFWSQLAFGKYLVFKKDTCTLLR